VWLQRLLEDEDGLSGAVECAVLYVDAVEVSRNIFLAMRSALFLSTPFCLLTYSRYV
jgi:hypothetical protein